MNCGPFSIMILEAPGKTRAVRASEKKEILAQMALVDSCPEITEQEEIDYQLAKEKIMALENPKERSIQ